MTIHKGCNPGTVIAPIFKPFKPLKNTVADAVLADNADNTAHSVVFPVEILPIAHANAAR